MLKNPTLLENFEKSQLRKEPADFHRNLQIFEALFREAQSMGVFPLKDPLEGIEVDIAVARVLNVRSPS